MNFPRSTRRLFAVPLLLLAAAVCIGASVPSAGKKNRGPTTVNANRLEFDYKDWVALFEGNVRIQDPEFTMSADRMLIFFETNKATRASSGGSPGEGQVRRVDAVGHVVMEHKDEKNEVIKATCEKAYYTQHNKAIVLVGHPVVSRGVNVLRGEKITVWLEDSRVVVEDSVQLQGSPPPKK